MTDPNDIKKVEKFIKEASVNPARVQMMNERYGELRGRRGKELELWHTWDSSGRQPTHLEPLLKSLDPLIKSETTRRLSGLGGSISAIALKNELRNATVRSLETFNPDKAQLTTHVINNFKRITDFVAANRNSKYMAREHVDKFQEFNSARTEIAEEQGREPTTQELQNRLGWSAKQIGRMQKGFGSEVFTDMGTDLENDYQAEDPLQQVRGALHLMRPNLTQVQQQFADLHYPEEGVEQKSVASIARIMKIPEHKAYRIKKRVEGILAPVIRKQ
jgi:hypothetical protein